MRNGVRSPVFSIELIVLGVLRKNGFLGYRFCTSWEEESNTRIVGNFDLNEV